MKNCGFLVLLLAMSACAEQPVSRTAADAVEFGYDEVECTDGRRTTVYAVLDSMDQDTACAALGTALHAAEESGLVSSKALVPDSMVLAVVRRLQFGRMPSRPAFPGSGIAVTIDLVNRQDNVFVIWPGIDSQVEVSWAPEGLKY